jgi:hypothetical protein
MRISSIVLLGLLALLLSSKPAHAASGYDNCTGFITSVPTVISTPGTWCLKQDLTTAITSGGAVTIAANNVTVDCNDFHLDGRAAGLGTAAFGIYADNQTGNTVRHCNILGFHRGLYFQGSGGHHLIEDNHFDHNAYNGLRVEGDALMIRRNLITATGGSTTDTSSYGITAFGSADIIDNTISGMSVASGSNGYIHGLELDLNANGNIVGNKVRGLKPDGTGTVVGMLNGDASRLVVRDNEFEGPGLGIALLCDSSGSGDTMIRVKHNVIAGFTDSGIANYCGDAGENDVSF